ncbi:MAG: transglutaminase-like domain-containing protein [Eubacteriales bacterium]|nr:transglutaminase-like domain-containing protein [Eubacteriales bacterium]
MKRNFKAAAYFTDILCALLLATVVNAAFFAQIMLESSLGVSFLATALATLFVFLLTRRWWVLPAVLLFSAATFALASALQDDGGAFSKAADFLHWCIGGFSPDAADISEGKFFLARLLFGLPAAALAYWYYRRSFVFGILPPVLLLLLYFLYRKEGADQLVTAACLCMPVFLISLAKATGRRVDENFKEEDRLFSRLLPVFALMFAPLIVLMALFLSPVEDGVWRAEGFANLVDDLQDAAQGGGAPYTTFGMKQIGFAPLNDRLGGDIELDDTMVMKVNTNFPVRLGGAVYNGYDGKTWYDAGEVGSYRFESMVWGARRREAFYLNCPSGGEAEKALFEEMTAEAEITVNYTQRGNTFFSAGQVKALINTSSFGSEVYFTSQGEINVSRYHRSLYYMMKTTVFRRGMEGFDEDMLALEALTADKRDTQYDAVCSSYSGLPETLPASVYETAKSITEGLSSPYEKARAIEAWLRKNCAYTLTPGTPPEGVDFVAHFLDARKGYCVYFASAMAVLARCEGLPSRFVTGYAIKRNETLPNSPNSYVATNATAHAWAEVYFKGIGWVVFDPLDWNFQEAAPFTVPPEPEYTPRPVETPPAQGPAREETAVHALTPQEKAALITAAAFLLLLVAFLLIRAAYLLSSEKTAYKRLFKRHGGDLSEMLDACFSRLVKQAGFLGISVNTGDTIETFSRRLGRRAGGRALIEACEAVTLRHYALRTPTEEDVKKLCALNALLEKRVKAELGIFLYLFRRVLTGK